VVNRDIKLENTLLDASPKPLVKITDFGYCKSDKESLPKSKVGTPGYTGARRAARLPSASPPLIWLIWYSTALDHAILWTLRSTCGHLPTNARSGREPKLCAGTAGR
jgi:hypothetical protein